jgi:hypothetical protein
MPRYPIYVPSKGRADRPFTLSMFREDAVPFRVVVEPQDVEAYAKMLGRDDEILVLPENDRGLVYARNWIKDHATAEGHERHWQFDDDIKYMMRLHEGWKLKCVSNVALAVLEDFVDRYENIMLASFNSEFFIVAASGIMREPHPPYYTNYRCYTCFLISNTIPLRWRGRYNEDTDMTLQVLASGWCTVLCNAFMINTPETMQYRGGQTDIYVGDGRLAMARELERRWPGVVSVRRRFGRPQHRVNWRRFTTPLRLKPSIDLASIDMRNWGLKLRAVDEVKSSKLRAYLESKGEE